MITVSPSSFLVISETNQTSTKVSELVVKYEYDLGSKLVDGEWKKQGLINSRLFHGGDIILSDSEPVELYEGYDIPSALHTKFVEMLENLNPKVKFTNTLA